MSTPRISVSPIWVPGRCAPSVARPELGSPPLLPSLTCTPSTPNQDSTFAIETELSTSRNLHPHHSLVWGSLKPESRPKTWVQAVYLGGDPRRQEGQADSEGGKEEKPTGGVVHIQGHCSKRWGPRSMGTCLSPRDKRQGSRARLVEGLLEASVPLLLD